MAYEHIGNGALGFGPCRYGASKLLFRGPQKTLDGSYCAVIGGSETYGKYLEQPYPDLLSELIGIPVVNLGCMNAGADVFALDDTVLEICAGAAVTVIQIMGAQNMSNRYYSVHPRRNDRFLNASGLLHAIYRDVDFTEFHFTGHLLRGLADVSRGKFAMIKTELQETWLKRMRFILGRLKGPVILLWLADHAPGASSRRGSVGSDPMFVDQKMLQGLTNRVSSIVEVITTEEEILAGNDRMVFTALEELSAREMMGPVIHEAVADKLSREISSLL